MKIEKFKNPHEIMNEYYTDKGFCDVNEREEDEKIGEKALIVNFSGFLDSNTRFIAEGLEKRGTECRIESVKLDEVELLRKNPAETSHV